MPNEIMTNLNEIIANYVNKKRNEKGLSISDLAIASNTAEGTVKNICYAKVDNTSMKTMIPMMDAVDGSFDEMLYPERYAERVNSGSIVTLMNAIRETNGEHVHDIRTHYEQHRKDVTENLEKRLADKREIIDLLKKELKVAKNVAWLLGFVLIALLIAEVANPNLGWLRY